MKTRINTLTAMAAVALLTALPMTAGAQDKVEASAGADLVSGYVWRGQELGGVSIQPAASVAYKGLSLAAWGSVGFESGDTKEFDLTLSYTAGGLTIGATDYWFNKTGDGIDAKYFNYGSHNLQNSHVFEAQIGYDFDVFSLTWFTNFAGQDGLNGSGDRAYSSYVEAAVPFKLGGLDFKAEVGAVPYTTSFYDNHGFSVTNLSLGVSKDIKVSDTFTLPLFVKATWNPRSEGAYFVAGLSF